MERENNLQSVLGEEFQIAETESRWTKEGLFEIREENTE